MDRKLEVMTPDCEKLLVVYAPTFDLTLTLFREARELGLEARLTPGQFSPSSEDVQHVWIWKDELGTVLRICPSDMTEDWRYCEGHEYQLRTVPEEGFDCYILIVFHAYFRDVVAAQVRAMEAKGNAA